MGENNLRNPNESDLIQYVIDQKNVSFADSSFNEVDGLVLSVLGYVHWDEVNKNINIPTSSDEKLTLHELLDNIDTSLYSGNTKQSENNKALLEAIRDSDRYRDIDISNYVVKQIPKNENNEYEDIAQFSAVTFSYDDGNGKRENFVSFRGTDGTLEGWCEDFNMAYDPSTNAQRYAVEYLDSIGKQYDGNIRIGGHSKGGNHAMYSYLFCDESVRNRILAVHNYDGPGFSAEMYYEDRYGNIISLDQAVYQRMLKLMEGNSACPYDSIIGQLLNETDFIFTDTGESLLLDHDAYTWKLQRDKDKVIGKFVKKDQSEISIYIDNFLDQTVGDLPVENRRALMTIIWDWLYSLGAEDFGGIGDAFKENWHKAIAKLIIRLEDASPEERKLFFEAVFTLIGSMADVYLKEKVPGYEVIRNKFDYEMGKRNIHSWSDFWNYIKEDPAGNLISIIYAFLSDRKFLKAILDFSAFAVLSAVVISIAGLAVKLFVSVIIVLFPMVVPLLEIIAAVIVAYNVAKLIVEYLKERIDQWIEDIGNIIENLKQKVLEWAEDMKEWVVTHIHSAIEGVKNLGHRIADGFSSVANKAKNLIGTICDKATQHFQIRNRQYEGLFHGIIRGITGTPQTPVVLDMKRLQDAVDEMDSIARSVGWIDDRLSSLYGKLCWNNIAKGDVFTSLANLYNLSKADICVDQGYIIRRKADGLSSLYSGYNDAEKWLEGRL